MYLKINFKKANIKMKNEVTRKYFENISKSRQTHPDQSFRQYFYHSFCFNINILARTIYHFVACKNEGKSVKPNI